MVDLENLARRFCKHEVDNGVQNLVSLQQCGASADLVESLFTRLSEQLSENVDNSRVLGNLSQFVAGSISPQSLLAWFEREPNALFTLLRLFNIGQYVSQRLIRNSTSFDLLLLTQGSPISRRMLEDELTTEVKAAQDLKQVMRILREWRHRETLRIVFGDFIVGQPLEVVTEQISILAEAIIAAALEAAVRELSHRREVPKQPNGRPLALSVIALGKLGGRELNYSSDIDLIFVREPLDESSKSENSLRIQAAINDYFERLAQLVIRLLSESTPHGIAYRVDMRLRPFGSQGTLVTETAEGLRYYELHGRTWERQALIKARPVAGNRELGNNFLATATPWIFRSPLSRSDISSLSALKRRIERAARLAGTEDRNIKTGHGGLRDIEFAVQFLQLLHGGEMKQLRTPNTLEAIACLHTAGYLSLEEQTTLSDNYRYLRKLEHFLQIEYDRQTFSLPAQPEDLEDLIDRVMSSDRAHPKSAREFLSELENRANQNRELLEQILHKGFSEETSGSPEADLILVPDVEREEIESVLSNQGFSDTQAAYRHLLELSRESSVGLSTRRSRHLLAAIVNPLLNAISQTPFPDETLLNLSSLGHALGGNAEVWELFQSSPAALESCVRLCATSPYLIGILNSDPNWVDLLKRTVDGGLLPPIEEMDARLSDLCDQSSDVSSEVRSFKSSMHLQIGLHDILGKEPIEQIHEKLSDVAEVCLDQVIRAEYHQSVAQLGVPMVEDHPTGLREAQLAVLGAGKLGGREPNYHSDLDVIFLFDADGETRSLTPSRRFRPTSNRQFFNQLSQRVIRAVTNSLGREKLYDLDVRLRPLGRSGELAITVRDLVDYFEVGEGMVWERQALCKGRVIWGSPGIREQVLQTIRGIVSSSCELNDLQEQIRSHRLLLQQGASNRNLKRGYGGTMDIEFIVQYLQLLHSREVPQLLVPGTLMALTVLKDQRVLEAELIDKLKYSYSFLRSVESGIRLMNRGPRHELPSGERDLKKLEFLLQQRPELKLDSSHELVEKCTRLQAENREIFAHAFAMSDLGFAQ